MSSRLFQELRDDNGLVYSVNVNSMLYYESGIFYISCSGDLEKFDKILNIIIKNLYKIKKKLVSKEEYLFNLEHLEGKIKAISDDLMQTAFYYGSQLIFDKSILTFDTLLKEKYNKNYITREKLNIIIDDILDLSKMVISVVGNFDDKTLLSKINKILKK